MISDSKLSKKAVVSTSIGKSLISSYLAKHVDLLDVHTDLTLDIDSEAIMCTCYCSNIQGEVCACKPYSIPVRLKFIDGKMKSKTNLTEVQQRKGEAEMSVIDWIPELKQELSDGDSIVSYITSADIDTILIHMFALSLYWERDGDRNFKWPVYVWLQKQKPELYDITGIILAIEKYLNTDNVAAIVSLILCMGGNDFLPNFHSFSHDKLLSVAIRDNVILRNLFNFHKSEDTLSCNINLDTYLELIKRLYCPPNLDYTVLSAEHIRQLSIKPPYKDFRHPQAWMPPVSALETLAKLIQCQVDYSLTCWNHAALLPDFLSYGCITRTDDGDLLYAMGPDMHTEDKNTLLSLSDDDLSAVIKRAKIVKKKPTVCRRKIKTHVRNSKSKVEIVNEPEEPGPSSTDQTLPSSEEATDQDTYHLDFLSLSDDDDVDAIPLAEMSLDDITASPESVYRHVAEKRPLEETPGKIVISKRLPRMSTPK